jgi:uncharacterized membrane protein YbhN (UPF0104 family)
MLKRILPWVVSLGLLAYLGWTTDLPRVWDAFQRVPALPFALLAVGGTLVAFLWDTLCVTVVFRRFNAPVGFREMLPLKGASYLLNIINYNAAMGGMALYLRRVRGVSFLESASSLLFMNVLDVFLLCALIGVGLLVSGDAAGAALSPVAREGLAWVVAVFGLLLDWNAGLDFLVLGRLRSWRIFHAFRLARLADWAWLAALRLPMVLLYVTISWLYAGLFGIDVPFASMVLLQPIVIFVGTVPITIAGLGTTQVVMRAVYGPFASYLAAGAAAAPAAVALAAPLAAVPGAGTAALATGAGLSVAAAQYFDPTPLVDAFSTGAIFSVVLVRLTIGYAFLARVSRELRAGAGARAGEGEEAARDAAEATHDAQ